MRPPPPRVLVAEEDLRPRPVEGLAVGLPIQAAHAGALLADLHLREVALLAGGRLRTGAAEQRTGDDARRAASTRPCVSGGSAPAMSCGGSITGSRVGLEIDIGPNLAGLGRNRAPTLADSGPTFANVGPSLVDVGPCRSNVPQSWPESGRALSVSP